MDKIKIQDMKIGQQVKFYFGSGEIVRLSDPAYQMRDCGDDYCISLNAREHTTTVQSKKYKSVIINNLTI